MPYHPHENIRLKCQAAIPFCHCNQALYNYFHEEDHSTNPRRPKTTVIRLPKKKKRNLHKEKGTDHDEIQNKFRILK